MEHKQNAGLSADDPPEVTFPGTMDTPLAIPEVVIPEKGWRAWWGRINVSKIALFFASLYLFILAITLMKEGARGLAPVIQNSLSIDSMTNSLGFGWLFAYVVMSGSPVAAAALAFFDAGIIGKLSTFAMITGSRLGASFIVLFIGFLYVLRGRDKVISLSMGWLSLTVTAVTYIPAFFLGTIVLSKGWFDRVQLRQGMIFESLIDLGVAPITTAIIALLPHWIVFLIGLGVILLSFNLFDKCLPQMSIKESQVGWMSRLVYRPVVMFALGALVTLVSMSVSLSLSILVPLSARGFIRRENAIPYIMGANITTFIDTLLAAVLLNNPPAFTVVLTEMASVAIISILILMTLYRPYQRITLDFVGWVTSGNRNLAFLMALIFLVPIVLLLL